jgi:predicted transcriptional regulator
MASRETPGLSSLENAVMRVVWSRELATAEDVRVALAATQPMKDSTVRTILRRLEEKGYATHRAEGRTYVYSPRIESRNVAIEAVRSIIDRFCQGSVEDLILGMVDDEIVSPQRLRDLAARVDRAEKSQSRNRSTKRGRTR